jgi:anti-sigma regulatory factor (Ser/Thr protein kinase)
MTRAWRKALARRLDPDASTEVVEAVVVPEPPRPDEAQIWSAITAQFAVRTLTTMYQMGNQLATVEADEEDPVRLERLFWLDHAVSRARRAAENMLVLTGRGVEDAGRQVTTLLDVIRAATSAIEHYSRVHIGRIAELAVVEFAADDLIRVVTELLDNATRFSPPQSSVRVAVHLTEQGNVLLRVEDDGFGLEPGQLAAVNETLAAPSPAPIAEGGAAHLGLVVVQRLARHHGLRVHLTTRQGTGTTATVLVPDRLLCEVPMHHDEPFPFPPPPPPPPPKPQRRAPDAMLAVVPAPGAPGRLPHRVKESIRGNQPPAHPETAAPPGRPGPGEDKAWADDAAAFDAGIRDARGFPR